MLSTVGDLTSEIARPWSRRQAARPSGRPSTAGGRRELSRHALSRAQQERTETATGAHGGDGLDQVHSGYGMAKIATLPACGPDDPGPVGQAEVGVLEDTRKRRVLVGTHHELGIDR